MARISAWGSCNVQGARSSEALSTSRSRGCRKKATSNRAPSRAPSEPSALLVVCIDQQQKDCASSMPGRSQLGRSPVIFLRKRDMLPGDLLHRIATRSCSTTTCERVIEPLIADLQREWLAADSKTGRAAARLHGYGAFWQALFRCGLAAAEQILTTRPSSHRLRQAGRFLVIVPVFVMTAYTIGWMETGHIVSWSNAWKSPALMPFWLGYWPLWSQWRRKPADNRPHLAIVMCVPILITATLCWFYPTRTGDVILLSVLYFSMEPLIARVIARTQRSREILRQVDERAEQFKPRSG
jgi:hypothetical protein